MMSDVLKKQYIKHIVNDLMHRFCFSVGLVTSGPIGESPMFTGTSATAAAPTALSALMSQQRLLELSRFGGLRGYDIAQHMLTQQGAVSKLLGKCPFI